MIKTVSWDLSGSIISELKPGQIQVTVSGGDPGFVPMVLVVAASPAVFDLPPETLPNLYTASVQQLSADASQIAMGAPATAKFSVVSPASVVAIPGVVTVT